MIFLDYFRIINKRLFVLFDDLILFVLKSNQLGARQSENNIESTKKTIMMKILFRKLCQISNDSSAFSIFSLPSRFVF